MLYGTAFILRRDTAVVLRVVFGGDLGAATDAGGAPPGTNVPAHVVVIIGTLHVVVAGDITLCIGGFGGTVLGTLAITRL